MLGSRAWSASHPEVVAGLQLLLNLDRGTGRPTSVDVGGLAEARRTLGRWLVEARALGGTLEIRSSGTMDAGGSDHAPFVCRGAPAFYLEQEWWSYGAQTWHSVRDSYDKLVFPDLRAAAVLLAALAYRASEDPVKLARTTTYDSSATFSQCMDPDDG
jgi:hypothetical protein